MKPLIIALLIASPAHALQCAPLADMRIGLAANYDERMMWIGASPQGNMVIVANPDGSTWTVLTVDGSGLACIIAIGPQWAADVPQGELN